MGIAPFLQPSGVHIWQQYEIVVYLGDSREVRCSEATALQRQRHTVMGHFISPCNHAATGPLTVYALLHSLRLGVSPYSYKSSLNIKLDVLPVLWLRKTWIAKDDHQVSTQEFWTMYVLEKKLAWWLKPLKETFRMTTWVKCMPMVEIQVHKARLKKHLLKVALKALVFFDRMAFEFLQDRRMVLAA